MRPARSWRQGRPLELKLYLGSGQKGEAVFLDVPAKGHDLDKGKVPSPHAAGVDDPYPVFRVGGAGGVDLGCEAHGVFVPGEALRRALDCGNHRSAVVTYRFKSVFVNQGIHPGANGDLHPNPVNGNPGEAYFREVFGVIHGNGGVCSATEAYGSEFRYGGAEVQRNTGLGRLHNREPRGEGRPGEHSEQKQSSFIFPPV